MCMPAPASPGAAGAPSVCAFEDGEACGAFAYSAMAGGLVDNTFLCASGKCGAGGYCCSRAAAALGCTTCAPATGSCSAVSAGEACAVDYDCQSGLCGGGCCCSVAAAITHLSPTGASSTCTSCQCFGSSGPAAALPVGACTGVLSPLPTPLPTLPPTTAGSCVTCDSFSTADAVQGVYILPAASPLNPLPGQDLALGKPGVCQDLALAAAAAGVANIPALLPCLSATRVLHVDGGSWEVLGPAAGLQMGAQPSQCYASPSAMPSSSAYASYAASASYMPSYAASASASASASVSDSAAHNASEAS